MWYFERNYQALTDMFAACQLLEHGSAQFFLQKNNIELHVIEETPYTILVAIQHSFGSQQPLMTAAAFKVRLYLDARVAEVVSYQGQARLTIEQNYPNSSMRYCDDKRQTNLLLYDWLSNLIRLDYKECIVESCRS